MKWICYEITPSEMLEVKIRLLYFNTIVYVIEHVYKQCNHISSVKFRTVVYSKQYILWASARNATYAFMYIYIWECDILIENIVRCWLIYYYRFLGC